MISYIIKFLIYGNITSTNIGANVGKRLISG